MCEGDGGGRGGGGDETAGYLSCPFWTAPQPVLFAALGPAAKRGRQARSWLGAISIFFRGLKALPPMNACTYWLIPGPQYSRVGKNEGGHARIAFLQGNDASTVVTKHLKECKEVREGFKKL